jgi:hypothetical protein
VSGPCIHKKETLQKKKNDLFLETRVCRSGNGENGSLAFNWSFITTDSYKKLRKF